MLQQNQRIGYQPGASRLNNVIAFLERHRREHPERVALRWAAPEALARWDGSPATPIAHREITYGDFSAGVEAAARGLHDLGIRAGDRAIIFLPMGLLMYTAMFAVQRLGAIAVFLDSWARRHHLGASAACVAPVAMISHRAAFDLVKEVPEFAPVRYRILAGPGEGSFAARLEELMTTPGTSEVAPVESETTALITFTTGSSGDPKGANRTHRFLVAQHEALDRVLPYAAADRDLPAFPIFSLNNLAAGVTTILPALNLAAPSERDPALLTAQIVQEQISCATLSPSMLLGVARYCAETGVTLPRLRRVVTGGAPISKDNVRAFKAIAPAAKVWVLYGSTEVEPMAHIEADEMLAVPADPDPEVVEDGVNVGHIDEAVRYKFLRIVKGPIDLAATPWEELEVPRGEVGEFAVSGDHVCRDYYNNADAFVKTKIRDRDGTVWHRTGDLARLDEHGHLWVVGRVHNAVERGGKYYFPVRAEVVLKRLPFVSQGAFLGLPDPGLGEKAAVAVALCDPGPDREAARREILRLFAKNQIPVDALYVVDRVPMDSRHHSKVEYGELRAFLLAGGAPDELRGA
jgi:acyl-CoA synthetase (AMP-forming)/AMP-acid ligase II